MAQAVLSRRAMRFVPALLLSLATLSGCAATAVDETSEAPAEPTTGTTEQAQKACDPSYLRACSNVCEGSYGSFCFWGTVCDPLRHKCEKTQPIVTATDPTSTIELAQPISN